MNKEKNERNGNAIYFVRVIQVPLVQVFDVWVQYKVILMQIILN